MSWRAPNVSTINGEFLGYQVSWKDRSSRLSSDIQQEQVPHSSTLFFPVSFFCWQVKDPQETVHIITGLKTYTQYLVSIQVINPEGLGPASTVVVMTEEGGKENFKR